MQTVLVQKRVCSASRCSDSKLKHFIFSEYEVFNSFPAIYLQEVQDKYLVSSILNLYCISTLLQRENEGFLIKGRRCLRTDLLQPGYDARRTDGRGRRVTKPNVARYTRSRNSPAQRQAFAASKSFVQQSTKLVKWDDMRITSRSDYDQWLIEVLC